MHVTFTTGSSFAGDLIGFTAGLLITILLLVLTLRASKLPGTPFANIAFATCALLWTFGGLLQATLLAAGHSKENTWVLAAVALQFTGAGAFPIPVLAIWRPFAVRPWQVTGARWLRLAAYVYAAAIAALAWSGIARGVQLRSINGLHHLAAVTAIVLLVLGAAVCLRRDTTPRAVFVPSLAIVCAAVGSALLMTLAQSIHGGGGAGLVAIAAHLLLLVALCAFFLFARFRFADVFIRYGVRILLAGVWAAVLALVTQSPMLNHVAMQSQHPWAIHVLGVILVANALLLSFTFVDERLSALVNRWLFRPPDYRACRRQLANRLRELQLEPEVAAAVEDSARTALELSGAQLIPLDGIAASPEAASLLEGETVELGPGDPLLSQLPLKNVEVLIPVDSGGRVTHALLIAPGSTRPGLVTRDLEYLRTIATQAGNRLDALRRDQEAIERQTRESLLQQQVTEAELRALRAQINPHFLFNSLNTIADLIVRNPPRAEEMTLRLASVFRHVLAHSARPLTSLRDEIEFLRTYLYIEEARFGDRLQVHIDVTPDAASLQVPTLILQPLVENALKHGLAPKTGTGQLWIMARTSDTHVIIGVEDDGMGLAVGRSQAHGVGLANVADRLKTLYGDRASFVLQPREGGGARVVVWIPRSKEAQA